MSTKELIDEIVECAKLVRKQLSYGFEEKVYKNAMFIELKKHNLSVEIEVPIKVYYDGQVVGDFRADMIVDKRIIIELKAINALTIINSVQLVNYLTATGIDDGLLINFGAEHLEIKHKTRLYYKCQ